MESVYAWSALVCTASIICTLIEFLAPMGKISKTMNMVLGAFMVCVVILPFSNKNLFLKKDFEDIIQTPNFYQEKSSNNSLNSQITKIAKNNINAIITRTLKNSGIIFQKIEIFMDTDKDNCIIMIRCKIHINKNQCELQEKIKNEIEKKLNIKTEVTTDA